MLASPLAEYRSPVSLGNISTIASLTLMLLALFFLLSIPIGCFAIWFGWKAYQVGKKSTALAMGWIALLSFGTALLAAGWGYLFVTS